MWMFREKLAAWVRKVTASTTERVGGLEKRMDRRETHDEVQAKVLENLTKNVDEGFRRVTASIDRLDQRVLDLNR